MDVNDTQAFWIDRGAPGRAPARICITGPAAITAIEAAGMEGLLPAWTYHGCLRLAAARHPDKIANIFLADARPETPPRILTYAELITRIEQAANLFHHLAAGAPSVVSVLAPALPEALIAMWGGAIAGACNPINPFLDIAHIASIMNAAGSTVLVTAHAGHGGGAWQRLSELVAKVPSLRAVLTIDAARADEEDFAAPLRTMPKGGLSFTPDPDPGRVSAYFHTGGTTAAPKLVRHTQRGQLLNAWLSAAFIGPEEDEIIGHGMPNFHVGGAILLSLRAFIMGQTLLTLTPAGFRDQGVVRNFWDIARRHRMTSVACAPTSAAMLMTVPDVTSEGHCLRTFSTGGGAMPRSLGYAFADRFGIDLHELWGMTEFQGILGTQPWGKAKPRIGSVGLVVPFHRALVARLEDGVFKEAMPPGEKGVLLLTGPCMTPGYLDEAANKSLFVRGMPDGRRWLDSGDVGALDADGFVWLYGRQKDLIVRGGHNIDPGLVEDVLSRHPAVEIAAAVGQPDDLKGELPVAYVQLRPGATVTEAELLALCHAEVAERAAVPVEIIVIDNIPVTAVGKIFKPPLRLDAMARVVRARLAQLAGPEHGCPVEARETAARPAVCVTLPNGAEDLAGRLREACAGFNFELIVERAGLSR
ncbi:AMP-binding protein [Acidocella sp.]|uniref:AMP-binding protein n=1 Tax=Acidocella sp. TaxID=50710 RepID=UPI00260CE875|nr:AMP-binding protein [Acidocella sp.]